MAALGLYVHLPFCRQHCPYCSFAVVTGHEALYAPYVDAVCQEIRRWRHLAARGPLQTVFLGGGTPSLLAPELIGRLLDTAAATLGLAATAEITLEANPHPADAARFAAFRALGCNRLSLGVQAFVDADLRALGRDHSARDAEAAYEAARRAGFDNVNLDLIFAIPGAPRHHWQTTLARAVALQPEHLSTYGLTIEAGTPLARRLRRGELAAVAEDDDAWAYTEAMEVLSAAGYEHYEVSNFARPGWRSRHNWGYWHGAPYLGVGLGAHSFIDGVRWWNVRNLRKYLQAMASGTSPCAGREVLTAAQARAEQIWLRLRTCEGVRLSAWERERLQRQPRFGQLIEAGLLCLEGDCLRLTRAGMPLADALGVEVVRLREAPAPPAVAERR